VPTGSDEIEQVALTPPDMGKVHRTVVPISKVTVPAGVAVPVFGETVAVNVTPCPKTDGSSEEMTVVVVADFGSAALSCAKPIKLTIMVATTLVMEFAQIFTVSS